MTFNPEGMMQDTKEMVEKATAGALPRMTAEEARERGRHYLKRHDFKPGDLVRWKAGLRHCKWPEYGEPAVVLDVRPGQVDLEDNGSTTCYQEPRDLRIGLLSPLGVFAGWWMDSSRFEPYQEPEAAPTTENV